MFSRTITLRSADLLEGLKCLLDSNWKAMADSGKPLVVTVAEYKAKRSLEQNSRLWALLGEISENAWVDGKQFSDEAWNEHFKRIYIGLEELPDGTSQGISTTKLSVSEFTDYMTKIEQYAVSTLGVELAA